MDKTRKSAEKTIDVQTWKAKTGIGMKVKEGEINNMSQILDQGHKILEPEIVDILLPNLASELLLVGQAKGKFGGGQRRVFKQTQKKTREGNKPSFATVAAVGNNNGFVGIGHGKSRETVPSREKGFRNAKLNVIKIRRGCGSWLCGCGEPHSIPFTVRGKTGSAEITLMPAPKGTGLCVEKECAKILRLAGIKDVWSKTKGQSKTKINLITACMKALQSLVSTKVSQEFITLSGMVEGQGVVENTAETVEAEVTNE
jgi:small subunit ribosomal protein S5